MTPQLRRLKQENYLLRTRTKTLDARVVELSEAYTQQAAATAAAESTDVQEVNARSFEDAWKESQRNLGEMSALLFLIVLWYSTQLEGNGYDVV